MKFLIFLGIMLADFWLISINYKLEKLLNGQIFLRKSCPETNNPMNRKLDVEKAIYFLLFKLWQVDNSGYSSFQLWLDNNGLFQDLPPLHDLEKLWNKYDAKD